MNKFFLLVLGILLLGGCDFLNFEDFDIGVALIGCIPEEETTFTVVVLNETRATKLSRDYKSHSYRLSIRTENRRSSSITGPRYEKADVWVYVESDQTQRTTREMRRTARTDRNTQFSFDYEKEFGYTLEQEQSGACARLSAT